MFNAFIARTWEHRISLYGAYLIDKGTKSATIKSYFSAIKHILRTDGYELKIDDLLLNTLVWVLCLVNDKVLTRLPIHSNLLEILLFEVEMYYNMQYYLEILYKTIFIVAYYRLSRIGEVSFSQHAIKAKNVNVGHNKNKILLVLYSSKTHAAESRPQQVKVSGIDTPTIDNSVKLKQRFFCPFPLMRSYTKLRGDYYEDNEQFFIFSDHSPVTPTHVRSLLKKLLSPIGLDHRLYGFHSFRIGRCSELINLGYSIETVKCLGHWKYNAMYKYIKG